MALSPLTVLFADTAARSSITDAKISGGLTCRGWTIEDFNAYFFARDTLLQALTAQSNANAAGIASTSQSLLTTEGNLQAQLNTEINNRQSGDNALGARLTVIEDHATIPQVQAGNGSKLIDAATLAAAATTGFSYLHKISRSGTALALESLDTSAAVMALTMSGAGTSSGIQATFAGTGTGGAVFDARLMGTGHAHGVRAYVVSDTFAQAVYARVDGNGSGNAVLGTINGSGAGSAVAGTVLGAGSGNGLSGIIGGSGAGHGVSAQVGGAASATGGGYAGYFVNGTTGSRLACIRATTTGANTTWAAVFDGSVWASGSYTTSDKSLKAKIRDIPADAAIIFSRRLRFVDFDKLRDVDAASAAYAEIEAEHASAVERLTAELAACLRVSPGELKEALAKVEGARATAKFKAPLSAEAADVFDRLMVVIANAPPPFAAEPDVIHHDAGVIAQEVQALADETGYGDWLVARTDPSNPKSKLTVNYQALQAIINRGFQLRLDAAGL